MVQAGWACVGVLLGHEWREGLCCFNISHLKLMAESMSVVGLNLKRCEALLTCMW
jgi:hypothetical protein